MFPRGLRQPDPFVFHFLGSLMLHRCSERHSSAIKACGAEGRWEEALGLLKEMQEGGVRPNLITYTGGMYSTVDANFG